MFIRKYPLTHDSSTRLSLPSGQCIPTPLGWWEYYVYMGLEEWKVLGLTPFLLGFKSWMCVHTPFPYIKS